jgi:hypothetical protein
MEDHKVVIRNLGGRSVNLTAFDPVGNHIMARNLDLVVEKLNSITGTNFTSGGVKNQEYMKEIPEFVLLVNNEHILTNENKFKLTNTYSNDHEIEEVAKYFVTFLDAAIGLKC